jgi:hypothetical protein
MRRISRLVLALGLVFVLAPSMGPTMAQAAWLGPEWQWRIPFELSEGQIEPEDSFADFTLLVDLADPAYADVFARADSSGAGLVVTSADGVSVLDHEMVGYDPVAATGQIWFQTPSLSEANHQFYLYFGQTDVTEGGPGKASGVPGAAWTPDHLAVYHFSEDPSLGTLQDWGPAGNDGTAAISPAPVGSGWTSENLVDTPIGTGWKFDGQDLWAYADNVSSADSSYTISAWFANSQVVDKGAMAFEAPQQAWNLSFQRTQGQPRADLWCEDRTMSWLPDIVDEEMHLYTWVLDGVADTARFYLDGVEQESWMRYTPPDAPGPIWQGATMDGRIGIIGPSIFNSFDIADGVADEFRLVVGLRDAGWILTEFRNQSDPGGFFDVGPSQEKPGDATAGERFAGLLPVGLVTAAPNPFRGVTHVRVETSSPEVSLQVFDLRGRLVRTLAGPTRAGDRYLRFLWDGRDAAGNDVSTGVYFLRARSGSSISTAKVVRVR